MGNDCTGERMLPIVLIVNGVFSVILMFDSHSCYYCCVILIAIFWHLIGCFFTFRKIIFDSYSAGEVNDCHPVFLQFVFILYSITTVVLFTSLGLLISSYCINGCTI